MRQQCHHLTNHALVAEMIVGLDTTPLPPNEMMLLVKPLTAK